MTQYLRHGRTGDFMNTDFVKYLELWGFSRLILCKKSSLIEGGLSHFNELLGDLDLEGEEGPRNARK